MIFRNGGRLCYEERSILSYMFPDVLSLQSIHNARGRVNKKRVECPAVIPDNHTCICIIVQKKIYQFTREHRTLVFSGELITETQ